MAPIAVPSRSLKLAMAFLARVTTGFWPLIAVSSSTAPSPDARRLVAAPADGQHVREVDRGLLLDDPARALHAAGLLVPLDEVHAFDDHAVLLVQQSEHLAGLATLAAGDDDHGVVLAD